MTYVMDKSRLSIRLVPPYSEERLQLPENTPNSTDFSLADGQKERLKSGQFTGK